MANPQDGQVVLRLQKYSELKASRAVSMIRLMEDNYQLVFKRYDPFTRAPMSPDLMQLNRAGAKALADGLQKQIDQLDAQKAELQAVINHLTVTMPADMDALDAAAPAEA